MNSPIKAIGGKPVYNKSQGSVQEGFSLT